MLLDCTSTYLKLSEFLDGRLPAEETAQIEAHLACCSDCKGLCDELRAVQGLLCEEMAEVDPPDRLWAGIEARIARESAAERAEVRGWWWFAAGLTERRFLRWAALPGLAVVLIALSVFVWPWGGGEAPQVPLVAFSPEVADAIEAEADALDEAAWMQELEAVVAQEQDSLGRIRWKALDQTVDDYGRELTIDMLDSLAGAEEVKEG